MLKFDEIVKVKRISCTKCLSLMYSLPCQLNREIVKHLEDFGKPLYPLKAVKLLRIDSKDGYKIDGKIGKNAIKFAIPKELENTDLSKIWRKIEFEACLGKWLSETLNMPVIMAQQIEKNEETDEG